VQEREVCLAGALDVRTGALHTTGGAHEGASLCCALLRDLLKHYGAARRIHLVVVEGLGDPPKFDREIRGRMTVVVRRNVTAAPAGN
jgi:hypothetical protein